jgi:uncharacterized membrane protein YdbT with pleckstrin-like domain
MAVHPYHVELKTNVKMSLNPNVKILWSMKYIAALAIVFLLFYAFEVLTNKWEEFMAQYLLYFIFMLIFLTFVFFYYIELKYKSYYYMITESEIIFRKGIINTVKNVVPFRDIQNLNIEKNILERILGIINLRIETAGANATESEIMIPGIEYDNEIVDRIRKRMEEIKGSGKKQEEIMFENQEAKTALDSKVEKRIAEMESRYEALSKKIEKKGIEIENVREEVSSLVSELKSMHHLIGKVSSSIEDTNMKMDALGKLMVKRSIQEKMAKKKK